MPRRPRIQLAGVPQAYPEFCVNGVSVNAEASGADLLDLENKTVRLSPGMAVTVEVKTGKRRVIEYFLSPLMQVSSESLRER